MTTRKWVTLIYFFARQFHQLCLMTLIPWPTACEWQGCFIYLPGSLINHVSSHDQQCVSDTSLFGCQTVSSIQSHPMTNSMWMALLYFFPTQAVWPIMSIQWQIGSEWQCFISLPGSLMTHQLAFLIPWPTGCEWHWQWLIYFFARQYHQSCLIPMTNTEWVTLWYLFARHLINPVSSHDQQDVSETALFKSHLIPWPNSKWMTLLFICQAVSLIMSHPMTNSMWVT